MNVNLVPINRGFFGCLVSKRIMHVCGQVRARQLWGNEVYTQDSDLVAVLMHCGFYNHALAAPPANIAEVPPHSSDICCPSAHIGARPETPRARRCARWCSRCRHSRRTRRARATLSARALGAPPQRAAPTG